MHYYQHHIGDFIKATARLSDSQTMTYLRMLWMYYDTEKPFSNDPDALAFLLGANTQEVILILNSFFKLIENEWRHTRCDDEIAKFHLKSDRAKIANKIRWGSKMDEKSDPDKIATNNHKPITNNKEYIDRFNEFWKHYPRKISKANAEKVWLRLKPDDELTKKIILAINKQGLRNREIQFVPHPTTWLNGQRWEDEVTDNKVAEFDIFRRAK